MTMGNAAGDDAAPAESPAPRRCRWKVLVVLVPWAVFLTAGLWGLDVGRHWDEDDHTSNVLASLRSKTLLPTGMWKAQGPLLGGYYGYPSVIYWIAMAGAAPEVLRDLPNAGGEAAQAFVQSEAFILRLRAICLVIASLAVVWVFGAVYVMTQQRAWPAFVASMLVATSWEIGYHARWVATDAIVMQWGALCLLLCAAAVTDRGRGGRWLTAAAVVAGLATGTKYPAGSLIVLVWVAAAAVWLETADPRRWRDWARLLGCAAKLLGVLIVTFLVTTPGALLQPWHFWRWIHFNRHHYAEAGHVGYTVQAGVEHVGLILQYLGLNLFSPNVAISLAIACTAVAGVAWLAARRQWAWAALLAVFPLLYLVYFTGQRVLIVRNLLLIAPFLAAAAGVAVAAVPKAAVRWRWAAGAVVAVVLGVLAFDAAWVLRAGATVRERASRHWQLAQLDAYALAHPTARLHLTEPVHAAATAVGRVGLLRAHVPLAEAERVIANTDGSLQLLWLANRRAMVERWFGPASVNPVYYPTWLGSNHLLVVPRAYWSAIPDVAFQRERRATDLAAAAGVGYWLIAYHDLGEDAPPDPLAAATQPVTSQPAITQPDRTDDAAQRITVVEGRSFRFIGRRVDLTAAASVVYHRSLVRLRVHGLVPGRRYRVGLSWLDFVSHRRVQGVELAVPGAASGRVVQPPVDLPDAAIDTFGVGEPPVDLMFDVPPELVTDGSFDVLIRGQPTPNAIVSEAWLYEATVTQ